MDQILTSLQRAADLKIALDLEIKVCSNTHPDKKGHGEDAAHRLKALKVKGSLRRDSTTTGILQHSWNKLTLV